MNGRERTYTARTLDAALARVKRELGHDAIIVSSRRLARGAHEGEFEVRAAPASESTAHVGAQAASSLVHRLLVRNGVEDSVARWLGAASPGARTLADARSGLAQALAANVPFARPLDSTHRVVAFAGPTGVGKTTTLAKIAAELAFVAARRVGIVTLDHYRVGAAAQIEQLADLIGVPLMVARDATSFARALARLGDADAILVDTAGRSPRDGDALADLASWLHGATEEPVCTCLCIAASTRSPELADVLRRHAVLRPTHLVVTKLDEATTHDGVLSACVASGLPLAWITTGQRVPEDIAPASAETLAAALCGEETYR